MGGGQVCCLPAFTSFGCINRVELLGHMVSLCLIFFENLLRNGNIDLKGLEVVKALK